MQVQFQVVFTYFSVTLNPYVATIYLILSSKKIVFRSITHLIRNEKTVDIENI